MLTRFGPFWQGTASRDFVAATRGKSQKSRYKCTKIDKARWDEPAGLVRFETSCTTRRYGGGHEDVKRVSLNPQ